MQRYVEQLIDDIRTAAVRAPAHPYDDPTLEGEDMLMLEMEESERSIGGPFELLCDIVDIPTQALPTAEKLSLEQMQLLNVELEKLMIAFNFYPEYPENVPAIMLYNAFLSVWNSEVFRVRFGQFHIDFCEGDEETCAFPGFCPHCNYDDLMYEDIQTNEFNIPANDLSKDGDDVAEDFEQIEKDYYENEAFTDDEGFIPGISNYCDRWCERCDFTDKCRLFQMESDLNDLFDQNKGDEDLLDNSVAKEELIEKADDFFDETDNDDEDADEEVTFEFGPELEDFDQEKNDYFSVFNKVERHPLSELADTYATESFKWLNSRFNEEEKGFMAEVAGGFANEIMEAEKVMSWYSLMIYTKLRRALSSYYEDDDDELFIAEDMNGSAKVALIGIDRSIEALTVMIRHLKKHRDILKSFRYHLEQMRKLAEETFPEARQFVRPGLDEL